MKNIEEILRNAGIEVDEEKLNDVKSAVNENYKTKAEYDKKISRLESERDDFKSKYDDANKTIESFNADDVENLKSELEKYKIQVAEAEKEYQAKINARDFDDALKTKMESYKFSSEAAKKAVMAEVKSADLRLSDGVILGLDDLMNQIKEKDAGAFAEEKPKQKFTSPMKNNPGGKKYSSKEEIFKIKDATERQAAISANLELFTGE